MSKSLPKGAPELSANDNADPKLVPLLIALSKSTNALLGLRLATLGLLGGQDDALMALSSVEPTSLGALAARLCVRHSTAAAVIGHLGEKGLVVSLAGKTPQLDHVTATAAGLATQQKVRQMHQQLESELLGPNPDVQTLIDGLSDLQFRLDKLLSMFC